MNLPLTNNKTWIKSSYGAISLIVFGMVGLVVWSIVDFSLLRLIFTALFATTAVMAYRVHVNKLEQKTQEITEFSRVHLATVEALANAIDARDQAGNGHVRRTQVIAVEIGKLLDLPESEINALRTGALLRDIGKLAIPDHILNKAGSLTAAELEKTKIHPAVGASILEQVGFDHPVVPTVRYHHECWDGRGYPEGLKGYEIPMTARILSVADAYDTLRSARPYRLAVERDKARQIIIDGAGTRFDPAIVQTLMQNLSFLEAAIDDHGLSYSDELVTGSKQPVSHGHHYVEQIKLANREVFSLYELAREFSSSVSLQETLEMFARKVGEFVPFDTCSVYLLDAPKKYATATYVVGANADLLLNRRIKVAQGATGFALKSGETVQNVDPDLDFSYTQIELTQQYSTMASVPLKANEELFGAVTIYARDLEVYGEEHIRLLETVSRIAADAIGKSLQHDEAKTHAMTDPMTNLPNARSLQIQFEKEVARASRGGTSFQLLMLDLDGFKAVNDSFGHKVGDEMLREVSKVIQGQLRDYDFLARYGGDEFVALIPDTGKADVIDLCVRIEKAVADFALYFANDTFAAVGVSLGASDYPKNGDTLDKMVIAADKVMYERKTARKRAAADAVAMALHLTNQSIDITNGYDLGDLSNLGPVSSEGFIVELDETHVLSASSAIN